MIERKLTLLGAALVGAMLAASAGAQDTNRSGYSDSGDRGVTTPANVQDSGPNHERGYRSGGPSNLPSVNTPASVPDERPSQVGQQPQSPLMRDSRLTPSPITPGNVSDSNAASTTHDRTNDGGMGIGGTR